MPTAPEIQPQLEPAHYSRERQILQRGSLRVVEGQRIADSQAAVLKFIPETLVDGPEILSLETEYTALKRLANCPGVMRVLGFSRHGRAGPFLALEDFADSTSLSDWIEQTRPDLQSRMAAALRLTSIVAAIHERRILHLNLNPLSIRMNAQATRIHIFGFEFAAIDYAKRTAAPARSARALPELEYISPEATGRIDRPVDVRSDLYSLGALFYTIFAERSPFASIGDALKLVHAHIARDPLPLHRLDARLPPPLSEIVLKLLSKNPEDRYENAEELAAHLQTMQERPDRQKNGEQAPPGIRAGDESRQFRISKKLYGRDTEIAELNRDFAGRAGFAKRFLLVSGNSGIGKSALVSSLAEPVRQAGGFFAAGKYDPLRRNIPYNAIAQAVRDWIEQVLTESPAELNTWRAGLAGAVGANGQVVADVIPEIEYLIGPSAPAQPLAPAEQRDRFNRTFRNLARVFTQRARPLVLFLDDLQWADLASLELLELLLADDESRFLYVVGAFRENEVEPADPLWMALGNIKKSAQDLVRTIPLGPLAVDSIAEMIADTMNETSGPNPRVAELAKLIQNYTGGNPFFIVQTLESLRQENHVWREGGRWTWDIERIKNRRVSNDVAALMADRLRRLPDATRNLVLKASCIGDTFDLDLLSRLNGTSAERTEEILNFATLEGLIVERKDRRRVAAGPRAADCSFVHDRVQQSAYAMLTARERRVVHNALGRLLLGQVDLLQIQSLPPEALDVFTVANHLNLGIGDDIPMAERVALAWVNLAAGRRARSSTAYRVSLKYFKQAADLLPREAWQTHHDLAIDLHRQWSECEYLSGNFDRAERLFNIALRNARRKADRADIYTFRIVQYTNQGRYRLALDTLQIALRIFNVHVSPAPSALSLHWNIFQTRRRLARLDDAALLAREDTHPTADPEIEACIRLLLSGMAPAYELAEQRLFSLLSMRAVQLSLRYGFTAESSFALACYGMTLSRWRGAYGESMRLGRLALETSARRNHTNILCRNQFLLGAFIAPWREGLGEHEHLRQGHRLGRESGNVIYGGYCLVFLAWHRFFRGENLADMCARLAGYENFFRNTRDYSAEVTTSIVSRLALNLQGLGEDPAHILDPRFDLEFFFEHVWVFGLSSYYLSAMIQAYLREDYPAALEMAGRSESYLDGTWVSVLQPEHYFYHALSLSAISDHAGRRERKRILRTLKNYSDMFRTWTANCPENFEPRWSLIEAERARLAADEKGAMRYFEKTILSARKHGFAQIEALASDLAARFYHDRGFPTLAAAHARDARRLYAGWGASLRVKLLERAFP